MIQSICSTHRANISKLDSRTIVADDISYYDRFLSMRDCARILEELETAFWQPSLTYTQQNDMTFKNLLTPFRVSQSAHQEWFGTDLNLILAKIDERLNVLFDVSPDHLEPWQATKYSTGGKFDYHHDAGYWADDPAGERMLTFLINLTTPQKGGGTHFRALDVYVEAKAGRLLVWNNIFPDGNCDYRMIHSSTPVERGKKITLVTWQRQRKNRRILH
jgi:prolyl 4-hydroxylase